MEKKKMKKNYKWKMKKGNTNENIKKCKSEKWLSLYFHFCFKNTHVKYKMLTLK